MLVGYNFNCVFGNVHDPVIAYVAGIARTVLAWEICRKLAPDEDHADPQDLYLHGKNAVLGCKEKAAQFFKLINDD